MEPFLHFKVNLIEGSREGTKYGRSLYKALKSSKSNLISYVMGDHWIDYRDLFKGAPIDEIKRLIKKYDLMLFADPLPLIADPSTQCKLLYDKRKEKILAYGKDLDQYSHVDMGFFIGKRENLLKTIEKYNLLEKDFDTFHLIQSLKKRFGLFEVRNVKWFGCNTPYDYFNGLNSLNIFKKKLLVEQRIC